MTARTKTSVILSGALLAIGLAACGGNDTRATATEPLMAAQPGARPEGGARARHRDPARFAQRFDANGNGAVELAELPERMQERMAAADANRDGVLAADEIRAFGEARRAARFARMDSNSDGAIEASEAGERGWPRLARADGNQDGRVDRAEMDAARASGALRGGHGRGRGDGSGGGRFHGRGHGPMDPARFTQRFDANGNGSLEVSELPPRMQARMGDADTNRDGVLAAAELTAALERRRAERAARGERGAEGATQDATQE